MRFRERATYFYERRHIRAPAKSRTCVGVLTYVHEASHLCSLRLSHRCPKTADDILILMEQWIWYGKCRRDNHSWRVLILILMEGKNHRETSKEVLLSVTEGGAKRHLRRTLPAQDRTSKRFNNIPQFDLSEVGGRWEVTHPQVSLRSTRRLHTLDGFNVRPAPLIFLF